MAKRNRSIGLQSGMHNDGKPSKRFEHATSQALKVLSLAENLVPSSPVPFPASRAPTPQVLALVISGDCATKSLGGRSGWLPMTAGLWPAEQTFLSSPRRHRRSGFSWRAANSGYSWPP
ncbi:conserved hypothetical protein [Coccidioides posadasii str. Silveira]|uniref:Uncharacterized protein n=2 Tax=Coccidioides posadasii TaxID=199306 RepID=E9D5K8_COCPS|nr:conserved hypothetical protein [Coccidioides posadasii str. Silveira]KMM66407.1 hypothetical protein CPAG_02746 [Coccidioides posadasii RMSCC 3488]